MARRKEGGHGGGHGWFVTFADLMGLLVSFFVMLVAFSSQDQKQLQIMAGSMRDAFGVQSERRFSGMREMQGLPKKEKPKSTVANNETNPESSGHVEGGQKSRMGASADQDRAFGRATTS